MCNLKESEKTSLTSVGTIVGVHQSHHLAAETSKEPGTE